MVLLGGLEFVAAGYILNEMSKDKKEKEEEERRKRRQDRKHHHRHDSPHPQNPPRQDLRPPQFGPPRPNSAPPPSSHPMAQMRPPPGLSQPMPGHPQHWQPATQPYPPPIPVPQPRPNMYPPSGMQPAIHPSHPIPAPQPRPNMYPPSGMQPATHPYPPPIPVPQPKPSIYPPPGVHIDMKTGRVQHNMLPPEMQSNAREVPQHDHPFAPNDGRARSTSDIPVFDPRQNSGPHSLYGEPRNNYSQPQRHPVASTYPTYPELDAETPGRYAPYDLKDPRSPPPPYQERDRNC